MAYSYTNSQGTTYYLHSKEVTLRGGNRLQRIYYFARDERKGDAVDAVPQGFEVVENKRTGLPVLRRK